MSEESAEHLVVAFNFPPYNDGSAVTAAKRIIERDVKVDVVAADLSSIRTTDPSLAQLISPWLESHYMVKPTISFASQRSVFEFANMGVRALESRGRVERYDTVFSRSMWAHSHFLAAFIKSKYRSIAWTAEFSDPLLWQVDRTPRHSGPLANTSDTRHILRAIGSTGQAWLLDHPDVLTWAQAVPYLLADTVMFTNDQQMQVMLEDVPLWMRDIVEPKAVVRPHPTLPREYYGLESQEEESSAGLPGKFKIGYFGTFYPNRGGGEFLEALSLLADEDRQRIAFDVYSANANHMLDVATALGVRELIQVHDPLPYLKFLAASDGYDALLVSDVATSPFGLPSPFLPSKYSDYAGSSAGVMSIVLDGSPLSKREAEWKARVGDIDGIVDMISRAIRGKTC